MQSTAIVYLMKIEKVIFIFIFVIMYFASRSPFLFQPLIDEEGLFATLFYSKTEPPNYLNIARIDGNDIFVPPEHPGMMYKMISYLGKFTNEISDVKSKTKENQVFLLRILFSLPQLLIWVSLLFMIVEYEITSFLKMGFIIFILSSTPLAISTSIQAQIDGSVGVLLIGLFSLLTILSNKNILYFTFYLLFSFFIGLGKQEWSFSVIGVSTVFFVLAIKNYKKVEPVFPLRYLLTIIFCLFGNVVSYVIDSENYVGGINVITRVSNSTSVIFTGLIKMKDILATSKNHLPLTNINLLLLTIIILNIKIIKRNENFFYLFVLGCVLFFGYSSSSFVSECRYFAPSLVIFATIVIYFLFESKLNINFFFFISIIIGVYSIIFLSNTYLQKTSLTLQVGSPIDINFFEKKKEENCIKLMPVSAAFYSDTDFIASSLGVGAGNDLAVRYGKKLCY